MGHLRIGALTRHREVLDSPVVRERYALLADAERLIADPLVRNMGTIGGDLANADPAEDLPAAFVALDSEVLVRGPDGGRTVHIDDLYVGPYETSLEHGEVLTEIRVPRTPGGSAYSKVKRKTGDYAAAAIGVALSMEGEEIESIRIGLCGVGKPNPAGEGCGRSAHRGTPRVRGVQEGGGDRRRGVRSHR